VVKYILRYNKAPENYLYTGNQKDGRGNIAPATLILPTIAMQTRGDLGHKSISDFMNRLTKKIEECRDSLIERFTLIASQSPTSATFMYYNNTMVGYEPEQGIISALKHGTLAIGQIGIAECLQILIGKDHTTEEGMELAKQIEELFNTKCAEYKEETYNILGQDIHLNFGVYYTPAESLCHTALNKFKEKYGIIPNVSDKEFFTNSIHIPVWYDITPFEKIDLESQLTGYSNAGCITYVELDSSASHNIDALEELVVYAMDKDIPYLGLNLPNDICQKCGWTGEINDNCPACGCSEIKRLRRVTGYITEDYLSAFNKGKVDEVQHRKKHLGIVSKI
jgi:ribonucleoside-triphosphate reductase